MLCTAKTEGALDLACTRWGSWSFGLRPLGSWRSCERGQDVGSDSYGIVRTLVAFDWGVDAEPASDMLVSNLIWGPVVTDARMVCDVIINLKEERGGEMVHAGK